MKKPFILLLFIWFFFTVPLLPAQPDFSCQGYFKNFSTVFDMPRPQTPPGVTFPDQPLLGLSNNRLRLQLDFVFSRGYSAKLAWDVSPRIQDPALFNSQIFAVQTDPYAYRFADFDARIYPQRNAAAGSFGLYQNLDRLFVTIRTAPADILIGRQAIAWGTARVINPTDIIAPFTYEELDTEDRIGVDAVRVRIPLGFMGELDAGYVFGKDFAFKKSAFFLRGKYYLYQTDFSLLAIGFRENLLAGLNLARSIGGAGFWLEAARVFAGMLRNYGAAKKYNYFRLSTGLDYSFTGKTYGYIEFHFNGAGTTNPEEYLRRLNRPAFTDGADYLMGKQYLAPGITYQLTPLITVTGQALINLNDPSLFLSPQVEYNIAKNIYISGGAYYGAGKGPEIAGNSAAAGRLRFRSEFGGYPDIYYGAFRIYF